MIKRTETTDSISVGPLTLKVTRRRFLKTSAVVPMALPLAAAPKPTLPKKGQPFPVLTLLGQQDGTTTITRIWLSGDSRRCELCPTCKAAEFLPGQSACTVLTSEQVAKDKSPLYAIS